MKFYSTRSSNTVVADSNTIKASTSKLVQDSPIRYSVTCLSHNKTRLLFPALMSSSTLSESWPSGSSKPCFYASMISDSCVKESVITPALWYGHSFSTPVHFIRCTGSSLRDYIMVGASIGEIHGQLFFLRNPFDKQTFYGKRPLQDNRYCIYILLRGFER